MTETKDDTTAVSLKIDHLSPTFFAACGGGGRKTNKTSPTRKKNTLPGTTYKTTYFLTRLTCPPATLFVFPFAYITISTFTLTVTPAAAAVAGESLRSPKCPSHTRLQHRLVSLRAAAAARRTTPAKTLRPMRFQRLVSLARDMVAFEISHFRPKGGGGGGGARHTWAA